MWEAIRLIDENKDRYPNFGRYIQFMELAEQQLSSKPDVCIEICKSVLEDNFVQQVANLIEAIAKVRNKRGDISHGKISPKITESTEQLAVFTLKVTDSAIIFLLEALISHQQALSNHLPPERIPYDNNHGFNRFLDQEYPLSNSKLDYSKALYELHYEDYRIQLDNWQDTEGDNA